MKEITTHHINSFNESLSVKAIDDPGFGNAHHEYRMYIPGYGDPVSSIKFQNGSVKEAGINGVSNEALLAIVIDRLQCFQTSSFSCRENSLALTKLEEALHWLKHRTESRLQRGVEGTHEI